MLIGVLLVGFVLSDTPKQVDLCAQLQLKRLTEDIKLRTRDLAAEHFEEEGWSCEDAGRGKLACTRSSPGPVALERLEEYEICTDDSEQYTKFFYERRHVTLKPYRGIVPPEPHGLQQLDIEHSGAPE